MTNKRQLNRVLDELGRQGCRIIKTRDGVRVLCPDGTTTVGWHDSLFRSGKADPRAIKNLAADIRRAGLTTPKGM